MNKTEFAKAVKATLKEKNIEGLKVDNTNTATIIDAVTETIFNALVSGEDVDVHNIGKLKIAVQQGRKGVIRMGARVGETYSTPAKAVVKYKASKALAEAVEANIEVVED